MKWKWNENENELKMKWKMKWNKNEMKMKWNDNEMKKKWKSFPANKKLIGVFHVAKSQWCEAVLRPVNGRDWCYCQVLERSWNMHFGIIIQRSLESDTAMSAARMIHKIIKKCWTRIWGQCSMNAIQRCGDILAWGEMVCICLSWSDSGEQSCMHKVFDRTLPEYV